MNREATSILTPEDKYAFDLRGYLVVENAIEPSLLEEANRAADRYLAKSEVTSEFQYDETGRALNNARRFDAVLNEEEVFRHLTMSPEVIGRVVEFIQFPRVKSNWLDFKGPGGRISFHGNHTPYNPVDAFYVQNGEIFANLVTVCFALEDIPPGGGALQVIPGSHKANFPLPEEQDERSKYQGNRPRGIEAVRPTKDAMFAEKLRVELPLKKGSALIFSHDMNHGSENGLKYIRRAMFTSFSTGTSTNTKGGQELYQKVFEESPEGSWQKYLFRAPKGDRDTYPIPQRTVLEEVLEGDWPGPVPSRLLQMASVA